MLLHSYHETGYLRVGILDLFIFLVQLIVPLDRQSHAKWRWWMTDRGGGGGWSRWTVGIRSTSVGVDRTGRGDCSASVEKDTQEPDRMRKGWRIVQSNKET